MDREIKMLRSSTEKAKLQEDRGARARGFKLMWPSKLGHKRPMIDNFSDMHKYLHCFSLNQSG